ncbi:uncharacterized protein LOC142230066 [Haematobia irritans]|uniref:Protein sleepless n=1 Tax=Haematobia irritans TaxID=7368 RepID=A0A1L8EIJ2_HAEIR
MDFTKIGFIVTLIAVCCFTYSTPNAIRCYICDNPASCDKPMKSECSATLANASWRYLDYHHVGVSNATSTIYECFSESIDSYAGKFQFKGCIYDIIDACELPLRNMHAPGGTKKSCKKCNYKDYCNPAGRVGINISTVAVVAIVGFIIRQMYA